MTTVTPMPTVPTQRGHFTAPVIRGIQEMVSRVLVCKTICVLLGFDDPARF